MAEGARYLLPVAVLWETMSEVQTSVTLRASLTALPEGCGVAWDGACLAELVIMPGVLHACTISTLQGQRLLQQEAAWHLLEQLGELEWTLHASFPGGRRHPSQGRGPTSAAEQGWQIASPLAPAILERLSQREKQVLLLTESRKGHEEIARLLGLPVSQIEQILEALAARQLIRRLEERRRE